MISTTEKTEHPSKPNGNGRSEKKSSKRFHFATDLRLKSIKPIFVCPSELTKLLCPIYAMLGVVARIKYPIKIPIQRLQIVTILTKI